MPVFALPLLAALAAINATPQAAVAAYGAAIERNDPTLLTAAFQPSAVMYCTDGTTIRATYQAQWKQRLRTSTAPTAPISTTIEWTDAGATTALIRATAVRGTTTFDDYLLLARIGGNWRIVGKLCATKAAPDPAATAAVGKVVDTKFAADRAWDPALLDASIDPRALVMTVEEGELVAATPAEWQARYVERRAASTGSPAPETSRVIDARGAIGVARWSFRGTDGSEWTDRALMIRTPGGWRMMALLFVKEVPGGGK